MVGRGAPRGLCGAIQLLQHRPAALLLAKHTRKKRNGENNNGRKKKMKKRTLFGFLIYSAPRVRCSPRLSHGTSHSLALFCSLPLFFSGNAGHTSSPSEMRKNCDRASYVLPTLSAAPHSS